MSKNSSPKNSLRHETLVRFFSNPGAIFGLVWLLILVFVALTADKFFDYENQVIYQDISQRLIAPCKEHLFGTDEFGRDLFVRVLYGTKMSLTVAFSAVAISLVIGGTLGAIAGYFGGTVDMVIMRFFDIAMAIPMLLMAICIVSALGASTVNLALSLGFSSTPIMARMVRASVITVRDMDYVESAKALGAKTSTIIVKHIIPNCLSPIIVQVTLRLANAIYNTSALSFLGMGVQPPDPEWGGLLSNGRQYIRDYSYLSVIPGLTIMMAVLALNLLGDGLRDALDPKLK